LWALGLDTGARSGELLALRWSDVDWDARTVHIDKNRVVVNGQVVEGTPKSKRSTRVVGHADTSITATLYAHVLDKQRTGAAQALTALYRVGGGS
jgi:hypothetical protein